MSGAWGREDAEKRESFLKERLNNTTYETVQRVTGLSAQPDDLSSIPVIHMLEGEN